MGSLIKGCTLWEVLIGYLLEDELHWEFLHQLLPPQIIPRQRKIRVQVQLRMEVLDGVLGYGIIDYLSVPRI